MTELEQVMKEKWVAKKYNDTNWWIVDVIMADPSGFVVCHTLVVGVAEKIVESHNKTIGDT